MKKLMIYIHGKGGTYQEAKRFRDLCVGYDVMGIDYDDYLPWIVQPQIKRYYEEQMKTYSHISIIAESIGAYFVMLSLQGCNIHKAYFISPILDMETLIKDMMHWANVTEDELHKQSEIPTDFGETLSWDYLKFVREHPLTWVTPTNILYAEHDHLTSRKTVDTFADSHHVQLTIMEGGEHWFHTEEQLTFLENWFKNIIE